MRTLATLAHILTGRHTLTFYIGTATEANPLPMLSERCTVCGHVTRTWNARTVSA